MCGSFIFRVFISAWCFFYGAVTSESFFKPYRFCNADCEFRPFGCNPKFVSGFV